MGALQSKHLPAEWISGGMAIDYGTDQMKKQSNQCQMRGDSTTTN
jgi:hypothetical protein